MGKRVNLFIRNLKRKKNEKMKEKKEKKGPKREGKKRPRNKNYYFILVITFRKPFI